MSAFSVSDLQLTAFADQVRLARAERAIEQPQAGATPEQLHEVAIAFEQILLGLMVESMRQTIPEDSVVPHLPGHELHEQMLYQEWTRAFSAHGSTLGLAEAIERQFADHVVAEEPPLPSQSCSPSASSTIPDERRQAGS